MVLHRMRFSSAGPADPPAEPPCRGGGGRPGQGPRPEHRGVFFLLVNDFNTCYDATLICLSACV